MFEVEADLFNQQFRFFFSRSVEFNSFSILTAMLDDDTSNTLSVHVIDLQAKKGRNKIDILAI